MKYIKKTLKITGIIASLALVSITVSNSLVTSNAANKIYNSTQEIPHNRVALLLGTGKFLTNGRINLYYKYRINAAVELFKSGKIEFILVSGDNSKEDYDEPSAIKGDLIEKGIPAHKIFLDYAGFRTLDSIVRSHDIFGQTSITIISQQFHNERALYIAKNKNITAIAFNAKDVTSRYGLKTRIREKFARVKMMLDLVVGKKPKYGGDKVVIR